MNNIILNMNEYDKFGAHLSRKFDIYTCSIFPGVNYLISTFSKLLNKQKNLVLRLHDYMD